MNIKEKLQSFGIDCDKDKNAVALAKKVLTDHGIKADRIVSKIDGEGEKILEETFKDKINENAPKKAILAPKTKKSSDEESITISDIAKVEEKIIEEKKVSAVSDNPNTDNNKLATEEKTNDNESKVSTVPFWKKNNSKDSQGLKIKVKGKEDNKPKTNTARPLPQSTIDEIERKKKDFEKRKQEGANAASKQNATDNTGEKVNKNLNKDNNRQVDKTKLNIKLNNGPRQGDKSKNFNKRGDRPSRPMIPNKGGTNKKITVITSNASIATGTNNRFEGKKKDKVKYNKEFDKSKQKNLKKQGKIGKHALTTSNYLDQDEQYRTKKKTGAGAFIKPVKVEVPEDSIKSITLPETITIKDFASKLKLQPSVIIKKLFMQGKMVTTNDELTYEEAENFALEYDILCEKEEKVDVIAELLKEEAEDESKMVKRPPVVCVMGHVDHGKTSILDAIRKTNVIEKEAGGITQAIGAYQVKINDRLITFLDTPGHEAFTAMRLRGAKSTDIAVLVVAADDGVMPQTIEAINHAKAANVEVVVCINKIDKPEANPEKIKKELSEYELIPEEWGGHTVYVETSAKKGIGIQNLLEMILLTADVLELKANPNRKARGIVIESELDKGKGPIARILVQKGTLKMSDYVAMGQSYGRIRAMMDCNAKRVDKATPSMPVEILGLNGVPQAGDTFLAFDSEKEAKAFASTFISENKIKMVEASKKKVTLDQIFDSIKAGELKELPIVVKADVAGSSEAVKQSLEKLSNDEVKVSVIHEGVGNISESDVNLASASNAIIIGFNVKVEPNAKTIVAREKIDVRLYDIIYKAIEDVEKALKGMLAPVYEEKHLGSLTIRQIFKASSVGLIAGCFVDEGEIRRNSKVRVKRGDKLLFDGDLASLKRFKDEVKEVKMGFECGVVIDGFSDFQVDDTIESYIMEEKKIEDL